MEIYIKADGSIINVKAKESIFIMTGLNTWESGRMIYRMERE